MAPGFLTVQRLDHAAVRDRPDRGVQPDPSLPVPEGQREFAAAADHGQPIRLTLDPRVADSQPVAGLDIEGEPIHDTVGLGGDQGAGRIEAG